MGGNFGDLTGQTFGTCTLIKPLGQGGMGAVYLARQTRPSRNVAVKILHASYTLDDQLSYEFLARFQREADVIARLEHINIMPIYEYGEQNNIPYLVMPYLTGGSFRDLLVKYGSLPLTDATTYIEQAASALDYAHSHGVIHRDLKPANFLLHADGRLVLADFGIARIIDNSDSGISALTHTGTIVGTPDYMAPEMAQGDPLDYHVDIYELGIVLYQMLTGHVPFTGSSPYAIVIQHIQNELPLIHVSNPNIPPAVDAVLQKATAKQPADRFKTAGAMALALRKAIQEISSQAQTVADQPQIVRTKPPISTTSIQLPQESYPTMQEQQKSVAPPIIANQAPVKMSASASLPAAQAHSISTLAHNQPQPAPDQPTSPTSVGTKRNGKWIVLIVALVILIGGGILGTTFLRNSAQQNRGSNTDNPAARQSATANTPTALPKGTELYSTTMPAPPPCNKAGDAWKTLRGGFDCYSTALHIQGVAGTTQLGGTLLNQLPNGQSYPSDYVVQAHIQSLQQSAFGIYFRNQPGSLLMGTYTFLVSPDGTWRANVYDNKTGESKQLASGKQTVSRTDAWMTLAVVVKGPNFSFYINDTLVDRAQDSTYPSGTAGIAVDHDGEVIADQFSLYAVVP
jgi:serine/threonine-protein kinase